MKDPDASSPPSPRDSFPGTSLVPEPLEVVIATAPGRAAVATIIVTGAEAIDCVAQLFRSATGKSLQRTGPDRILYGRWLVDGELGEDLIVAPRTSSHVEIHCHGGAAATSIIARTLMQRGATQVDRSHFLSRKLKDRFLADYHCSLSAATTEKTAMLLLNQLRQWPSWLAQLRESLAKNPSPQNDSVIVNRLDQAMRWSDFGQRLVTPASIALCGSPNVGKSSLVNALLGFDRSIVNSIAGTTRDIVEDATAFDGWPVRLFDTAGLRATDDAIEQQGIAQASSIISAVDLSILVTDPLVQSIEEIVRQKSEWNPAIVVANKSDLHHIEHKIFDAVVSAKERTGLENLIDSLVAKLYSDQPKPEQIVPVTRFQNDWLKRISDAIKNVDQGSVDDAMSALLEVGEFV